MKKLFLYCGVLLSGIIRLFELLHTRFSTRFVVLKPQIMVDFMCRFGF
jgi:hypothetical protein